MNVKFLFFAILFLLIGIVDQVLNGLGHYFSPNSFSFHYHFFILSIILYILAYKYRPHEPKVWLCENCNTKASRAKIKFGLCPKCNQKIKNFQGITSDYNFNNYNNF